jgi:dihydropteroate synthase
MDNKSNTSKRISTQHGTLDLSQPAVMGILNITPDSFYDGGKNFGTSESLAKAAQMIEQGVDIIDIGGQSTKPNSERISAAEELDRIGTTIEALRNYKKDIIISVDTFQSEVAEQTIALGADIINDISGATMDKEMWPTLARLQVPYIGMHIQGTPDTMQIAPSYTNVVEEVYIALEKIIQQCHAIGMQQIIVDPGFGFGKSVAHNFELLKSLDRFKALNVPLLIGISRKSFIYKTLEITADDSLAATTALHLHCLQNGADILRVHDVQEAKQVIQLYQSLNEQ